LYDYLPKEIIGMCITKLIPAFETVGSSHDDDDDNMDIDRTVEFNSSRSRLQNSMEVDQRMVVIFQSLVKYRYNPFKKNQMIINPHVHFID